GAIGAGRWVGRGDKNSADAAAVDGMRLMLDTVSMNGRVVIGEGEKDEAPMLYNGEEVGDGTGPEVDVAVDPLEGTRLCALAQPNAIGVIAAAGLKCVGGGIQGKLWPRNDDDRKQLVEQGIDPDRVLHTNDLVAGEYVFVAATGVTTGSLLRGVRYLANGVITDSIVMR